MARRRADPPAELTVEDEFDAVGLPEILRRCFAEDWVVVGEPKPCSLDGDDWELIVAWSRWRDAREAWCAQAAVDGRSLPGGAPHWRDRPLSRRR